MIYSLYIKEIFIKLVSYNYQIIMYKIISDESLYTCALDVRLNTSNKLNHDSLNNQINKEKFVGTNYNLRLIESYQM